MFNYENERLEDISKYGYDWFEEVMGYVQDYLFDYGGLHIIDEFLERLERFREESRCEILAWDFSTWEEENLYRALSVWKGFDFSLFESAFEDLLSEADASSKIFDELNELLERVKNNMWRVS